MHAVSVSGLKHNPADALRQARSSPVPGARGRAAGTRGAGSSGASPLIALARVGGLSWLQQLFTEVIVTDVVIAEVLTAGWLQTVAIASTPITAATPTQTVFVSCLSSSPSARATTANAMGARHARSAERITS